MKKALIFDLDGTLVDTLIDLSNAVNAAFSDYHLPLVSVEEVRNAIGNGTKVLIATLLPSNTSVNLQEEVFNRFKNYYSSHYCDHSIPYKEVKNVLIKLKDKYDLFVLSNKDNDLANLLIRRLFGDLFVCVQGSYSNKPKKPNPYLFNKLINDYRLLKEQCLYIGDTEIDKKCAMNAAVDYLLVNYGYRDKRQLLKTCPSDTSYDNPNELYNKIISL